MAHQNQSNSSRKQKRNRGRGKIGNKLANRLDQWKKDAETRQQAHSQNRNYQQTQVGSFDRDHLEKKIYSKRICSTIKRSIKSNIRSKKKKQQHIKNFKNNKIK
eukprot:704901_1